MGLTLDVAKDERSSEARWQTVELCIEDGSELIRLNPVITMIVHVDLLQPDALDRPPALRIGTGAHGYPAGNPVEPASQDVAVANRFRVLDQDQECGLEGIFDVVFVVEDVPANAEHHPPMPVDDRLESRFITSSEKSIEKLVLRK